MFHRNPVFGYNHNLPRLNTTRQRVKRCTRIWRVFTVISLLKSRENSKRGKKRKNWKKWKQINLSLSSFQNRILIILQQNQRRLKIQRNLTQLNWELRKMSKLDQRLWELIQFFKMLSTPLIRSKLINRFTRTSTILSRLKLTTKLNLCLPKKTIELGPLNLCLWEKNKKLNPLNLCQSKKIIKLSLFQLNKTFKLSLIKPKMLNKMQHKKLKLYHKFI